MEKIKVSEILSKDTELETLCYLLFNIKDLKESYFISEIIYKESKFADITLDEKVREENNKLMSSYFKLPFNLDNKIHKLYIYNDIGISLKDFLDILYNMILLKKTFTDINNFNRCFINSLFLPRGSTDISRNYFSVDIYKNIIEENHKILTYILNLAISTNNLKQFNFNFRELQPDYTENNKKRNSQIRINLRWYFNNYIDEVKKVNIYEYDKIINNENKIKDKQVVTKYNDSFLSKILYYKNNILHKSLSKLDIENFRNELNYIEENKTTLKKSRNSELISIAKHILPDECFACKDIYDIKDRSFILKKNNRWYLEIHHVISYSKYPNGDVIENLVKLCPTCHAAITSDRSYDKLQYKIISNILNNSPDTLEYARTLTEIYDFDELVFKIKEYSN